MCVVVFMAQNTTASPEPALKITFEKFAHKYPKTATLIGIGAIGCIISGGAAALKYAQLVHGSGENSRNRWIQHQIANEAQRLAQSATNRVGSALDATGDAISNNGVIAVEPGTPAHRVVESVWGYVKRSVTRIPEAATRGYLNFTQWNAYSRQYDREILYPAMGRVAKGCFLPGCVFGLGLHCIDKISHN